MTDVTVGGTIDVDTVGMYEGKIKVTYTDNSNETLLDALSGSVPVAKNTGVVILSLSESSLDAVKEYVESKKGAVETLKTILGM